MSRRSLTGCMVGLTVAFAHHAMADSPVPSSGYPPEIDALMRCRGSAGEQARLACYDLAVAAVEQAMKGRELHSASASPSGSLPQFGLPPVRSEALEPSELKGTVKSAQSSRDGWVVVLEDGSVWRQVDATRSAVDPRPGQVIAIQRGALGSYRLMINSNVGFKVQRAR